MTGGQTTMPALASEVLLGIQECLPGATTVTLTPNGGQPLNKGLSPEEAALHAAHLVDQWCGCTICVNPNTRTLQVLVKKPGDVWIREVGEWRADMTD